MTKLGSNLEASNDENLLSCLTLFALHMLFPIIKLISYSLRVIAKHKRRFTRCYFESIRRQKMTSC